MNESVPLARMSTPGEVELLMTELLEMLIAQVELPSM